MEAPTLIVTGASRGLGAGIAREAARLGANIVLVARSTGLLQAEARKVEAAGGRALAVGGDVSREADCRAAIDRTLDHFGRLDALINNAGIIEPIAPLAQASPGAWERSWAINLLGPVMLSQLALPALRDSHGRVINITSGAAQNVIPAWGAYSAAKIALNHLTRILAAEEPAITALAVRPGIVDTEMQAVIRATGKDHMAAENYNRLYGAYESGQLLPPEAPGLAIACLALYAPHEWSGEVLQWDEERVQQLVRDVSPPH